MEPAKIFWWWGGQSVLITQVAVSYLTVIAKGLEGVTQIKDDDVIHRLGQEQEHDTRLKLRAALGQDTAAGQKY